MSINCRICRDQLADGDPSCPTCGCEDPQPQPAEPVTQTGPHPSESGGCILPAEQSANEPEQDVTPITIKEIVNLFRYCPHSFVTGDKALALAWQYMASGLEAHAKKLECKIDAMRNPPVDEQSASEPDEWLTEINNYLNTVDYLILN